MIAISRKIFRFPAASLFAAVSLLTTPSVNAAFTIIATDNVEDDLNYTYTGAILMADTAATTGLSPLAGSLFIRDSTSNTAEKNLTAYYTSGFGGSTLVSAGTYRATAYFGEFDHARDTWHTVNLSLMTNLGVAWESLGSNPISKTVITPYVNPNGVGLAAEWVQVVVEYVIPESHALIGTQFTWGFSANKPANSNGYFAAFDAASVQFQAIPEPSPTLLSGIGAMLALILLRRRRH